MVAVLDHSLALRASSPQQEACKLGGHRFPLQVFEYPVEVSSVNSPRLTAFMAVHDNRLDTRHEYNSGKEHTVHNSTIVGGGSDADFELATRCQVACHETAVSDCRLHSETNPEVGHESLKLRTASTWNYIFLIYLKF